MLNISAIKDKKINLFKDKELLHVYKRVGSAYFGVIGILVTLIIVGLVVYMASQNIIQIPKILRDDEKLFRFLMTYYLFMTAGLITLVSFYLFEETLFYDKTSGKIEFLLANGFDLYKYWIFYSLMTILAFLVVFVFITVMFYTSILYTDFVKFLPKFWSYSVIVFISSISAIVALVLAAISCKDSAAMKICMFFTSILLYSMPTLFLNYTKINSVNIAVAVNVAILVISVSYILYFCKKLSKENIIKRLII